MPAAGGRQQQCGRNTNAEERCDHDRHRRTERRAEPGRRGCDVARSRRRVPAAAPILQAFAEQIIELLVVHVYA
jgi:hypothetical protein